LLAAWLWSMNSSALWFGDFAAMLVVPFLVAQLLPLWMTDAKGRVLLALIGLAMLALLRTAAPAALAVLAACYSVVRFGLPWSVQKSVEGKNCAASTLAPFFGQTEDRVRSRPPALGFPYALLTPSHSSAHDGVSLRDAVGIAVMLSAWLFALATYAPPEARGSTSYFAATAGLLIAMMGRVIIYVAPFQPPISFLGRVVNRIWFIPNYDRIFLPAICASAPLLGLWLVRSYVPDQLVWTAPLALGAGWIIALGMPPTLHHWALTGSHRIATAALPRVEYIEI
jgi:hypothetical protein